MIKRFRFFVITIAWFATSHRCTASETSDQVDLILAAQKDDLPELRLLHRKDPDLSFLILDQWVRLSPSDVLRQDLSSDEEDAVWLLWGRHHEKNALIQHDESPIPDDLAIPFILQGYAESAPDEVISLITNNPKYQAFQKNTKVGMGIVRGLALREPVRAIEYIETHSPQKLKGYPSVHMTEKAFRSAIWRWLCFEPEHALNWILKKNDPPLIPDCLGVLATQLPQEFRKAHSELPTGLMKKTFHEGLILAESADEDVLGFCTMASALEIATTHTFRNLVDQAKLTKPETFPAWLSDQRFEHLDHQKEILIRSIIQERWAEVNPEALVQELGKPKSWELRYGIYKLIRSVGSLDAEDALSLYLQHEKNDLLDGLDYEDVLLALAEKDREAFLRFVLADKTHQQKRATLLARVWLPRDLDWTVKTLTSHKINPFEEHDDPFGIRPDWDGFLFEAFEKLPESWQTTLLNSLSSTSGDEIRWLSIKSHPSLNKQELKGLQSSITIDAYWVWGKNLPQVIELVEHGVWLENKVRSSLADWVVIRSGNKRRGMIDWLNQLPPEIHTKALETWKYFELREIQSDQKKEFFKPGQLLENLLKTHETVLDISFYSWTAPEVESFHQQLLELDQLQAIHIFKTAGFNQFPWRIRVKMLSKILTEPLLDHQPLAFQEIRRTSKDFATWNPAEAAAWTATLPQGRHQKTAYEQVAEVWKDYNRDEAEAWILTLPKRMREILGYR